MVCSFFIFRKYAIFRQPIRINFLLICALKGNKAFVYDNNYLTFIFNYIKAVCTRCCTLYEICLKNICVKNWDRIHLTKAFTEISLG